MADGWAAPKQIQAQPINDGSVIASINALNFKARWAGQQPLPYCGTKC
jgi:hypothetical protein